MVKKGTITITLTEDLQKRIEDLQYKTGMNRSATISMLLSEALDAKSAIGTMEKMLLAFGENGENIGKILKHSAKK